MLTSVFQTRTRRDGGRKSKGKTRLNLNEDAWSGDDDDEEEEELCAANVCKRPTGTLWVKILGSVLILLFKQLVHKIFCHLLNTLHCIVIIIICHLVLNFNKRYKVIVKNLKLFCTLQ